MSADRDVELFGSADLDSFRGADVSALDVVDHLLDKGCVVTGQLVLGLANVDLIVIELSLVLAGADRMLADAMEPRER